MGTVRTETLQETVSTLVDDEVDIHISGQPGIGKSKFITHLQDELGDDFKISEKTVRIHDEPADLHSNLLHATRHAAPLYKSQLNKLTSLSASAGSVGAGGGVDDRARNIHKLQNLTERWSGAPLLLCIDDIHKISEDQQVVREIIAELSAALGDGVHLVTAGQISDVDNVEEFPLELYTVDETTRFLEAEFGSLPDDTVHEVHKRVQGHPLYLGLLTEASDDETDLQLPEDEVQDTIERRYIETLPFESARFLREVAPLPELDEKTCAGVIDDLSLAEADQILRRLNRRVIVERVNRTDDGDNIYKLHEHFRTHLERKHRDEEALHRNAFHYHITQIIEKLTSNRDNSLVESLPQSYYANYHLTNLYPSDVTPDAFREEIDRLELPASERFLILVYAGLGFLQDDVSVLWRQELDNFQAWLEEQIENEHQAEFLTKLAEWGISQFEEDPMRLSDIEVDGSLDDLSEGAKSVEDTDLPEDHARRLQQSWHHILRFFLLQEPYQRKTHRNHVSTVLAIYGVSPEILSKFHDRVFSLLMNRDLGDNFEDALDEFADSIINELEPSLTSSVDFYELRDESMDLAQEMLVNLHYETFLYSGVIEEIVLEGGEVLEDAENPAFAMMWYGVALSYHREVAELDADTAFYDEVEERYRSQLEARLAYEDDLEDPIVEADESPEVLDDRPAGTVTED